MAKNDAVTVSEEFQCVKETDCAWCGTTFQYPYKTTESGSGPNELQAKRNAAEKAQIDFEKEPGSERCPTCGALQVSMEARSHARGHGCAMWFAAIFLAVAVVIGMLLNEKLISSISLGMLSYSAIAGLLIAVVYNLRLVRRNENSNLELGLAEAKQKLAEGKIRILSRDAKIAVPESIPRPIGLMQYIAIGLSLIGVCLLPAAEIARLVSGWPSNSISFPPVAGPGDEVTLYWPESLSCLKNH